MSAQDLILGARVAHVRELQTALAQEKAANAALRDENAALKAHFDFALLAAEDLKGLKPGERLELWDGWNLVLGAQKEARDRADRFILAYVRMAAYLGLAGRLAVRTNDKDFSRAVARIVSRSNMI